jgi:hypothetical protein
LLYAQCDCFAWPRFLPALIDVRTASRHPPAATRSGSPASRIDWRLAKLDRANHKAVGSNESTELRHHSARRMTKARLLLLAISSVMALAMAETLARFTKPSPPADPLPGALFLSSPHFRLDERGAVRHVPDEQVRLVMLHGGKVDFDNTFHTNNLGLVDHRDYFRGNPARRSYAFVGDSFVYGMGAEPWVPQLRDSLRASGQDIEIYNLGVSGASIQHFRKLLTSVAADVPITHIIALPISHDFYRPWWVPVRLGDKIVFCREPDACDGDRFGGVMHIVDRGASPAALLARYETLMARADELPQAHPPAGQPRHLPMWRRALYLSELYVLAHDGIRGLLERFELRAPDPPPSDHQEFLGINLDALAGIRADFPGTPITLVHFPEKDEIENGRYRLNLRDHAESLGIQYFPALRQCSWSPDMYHAHDGHPNAKGYANMQKCLTEHFFLDQFERE